MLGYIEDIAGSMEGHGHGPDEAVTPSVGRREGILHMMGSPLESPFSR